MSNLLEVLRTHSEERKAASIKAYTSLVANLASEKGNAKHPDPDDLLAIIKEAGKTVEELEADVQRRKNRIQAAALLKTLGTIEKSKATVENRIAALVQERDQIIEEFKLKIQAQNQTLRGLVDQTREVDSARRLLEQTASQDLQERIATLVVQQGRLSDHIGSLERELAETEKVASRPMPVEPTPRERRELGGNGGYLQPEYNAIDAQRSAITRAAEHAQRIRVMLTEERPKLEAITEQLKTLRADLLIP